MGAGTSSGRTTGGATASGSVSSNAGISYGGAWFDSAVRSYGGKALTSRDIDEFGEQLAGAPNGDRITAMETNRWHQIEVAYTKTPGGWAYTRTNLGTGEVYQSRTVDNNQVADDVLSTAHTNEPRDWMYRKR